MAKTNVKSSTRTQKETTRIDPADFSFRKNPLPHEKLGAKFFSGDTSGFSTKMPNGKRRDSIFDGRTYTYLVGYEWAVYAKRNKKTGKITYYRGWETYSNTTRDHIRGMQLEKRADEISDNQPELRDVHGDYGDLE